MATRKTLEEQREEIRYGVPRIEERLRKVEEDIAAIQNVYPISGGELLATLESMAFFDLFEDIDEQDQRIALSELGTLTVNGSTPSQRRRTTKPNCPKAAETTERRRRDPSPVEIAARAAAIRNARPEGALLAD